MQHESLPNTGPTFLSFATCGASALTTYLRSICSAAASPASPIAPLESDEVPLMSVIYGPSSGESLANLDPDGCWRKTSQGYSQLTLDGSLEAFSGTWPRSGMVSNGIAYKLPTLAPRISGTGSTSWPTPTVPNGGRSPKGGMSPTGMTPDGKKRQVDLQHAVRMVEQKMWPTPTVHGMEGRNTKYAQGGTPLTVAVREAERQM